jgi:WD40 repeat protein
VISAAFSPDDRWIASGNENGRVTIWNASTGQKLLAFAAHERHARCVAFSPDGRHLATASWDGTVRVWNFNPQRVGSEISLLHTLKGEERRVHSVAFSPNSERLASASEAQDGKYQTVRVWDVASGQQIDALRGHTAFLWCVAYSPDGQYLASGSYDHTVRIWDAKTGQEKHCLPHSATVFGVSFSQDGRYLAASSGDTEAWSDGEIKVWDVRTGRAVGTLSGHTNRILSTAFSPDGQRLASAGRDGTVKLWDLQTGHEVLTLRGHHGTVHSVAFSRDGNRLVTAGDDRTVRVWDGTPLKAEASQEVTLRGHNAGVCSVAFNPNGLQFASRAYDGTVRVWDFQHGVAGLANPPLQTLSIGKVVAPDVVFSNDGHLLALRGDHKLTVWDTTTWKGSLVIAHDRWAAAFSPDRRYLATTYADGPDFPIEIVDAASGRRMGPLLKGHSQAVPALAFSPDPGFPCLASASVDGTVRIWYVTAGKEIIDPLRHANSVLSVAFSRDGRRLASGSEDRTVKVWDVRNRELRHDRSDPTGGVLSVAFHPRDDRVLAWGSTDGTVKIWNSATNEIRTLRGHTSWVKSVAFSPDGEWIASGSLDKTVKIWKAPLLAE